MMWQFGGNTFMVKELAARLQNMVERHLQEQKKADPAGAAEGKYTQEKLAHSLKLDPGTVSKYLNGRLLPSTTFARKLVRHIHGNDPSAIARIEQELDGLKRVQRDRKSTRLNSSHLGISYAVFCLKKKKKNKK